MNHNITVKQIKAARALLDWSQSELGKRAGLTQTAIANIENGRHRPTENTLESIYKAFDQSGIEFIDGGVRERPHSIEVIEGEDFTIRMPQIAFETMLHHGVKEVLVNGVDFSLLDEANRKNVQDHIKRLQDSGMSQRILVAEGTKASQIIGPAKWYRAVPKDLFSAGTPSMIYHDRFAIMLFDKQQVIIIRNANLAEYQKRQFDYLWAIAAPLA